MNKINKHTPLLFIILTFLLVTNAGATPLNCKRPTAQERFVYTDDFKGSYASIAELKKSFEELYESGSRLKGRVYYDEKLQSYIFPHEQGPVKIDDTFIKSITKHIEVSLERRYADFIFFPDMGHSHLHLPEKDYDKLINITPNNTMYEVFFANRNLKVLYHTAEKLAVRQGERFNGPFPQDPMLLWRYFSRNPVGDNNGGENVFILFQQHDLDKYNTVKDVPGYLEYSSGFDLSASKNGCFPYKFKEKIFYFDMSLESLPCRNCGEDGEF